MSVHFIGRSLKDDLLKDQGLSKDQCLSGDSGGMMTMRITVVLVVVLLLPVVLVCFITRR